jgi:opacity protein-like surface antigen
MDFCSYKENVPERLGDVSESTTGFHAEVGSYLDVMRGFFLDLNIRYLKATVEPFDEKINLGGLRVGLGFGYRF